VDPDLVGAAGVGAALHQRVPFEATQHAHLGEGSTLKTVSLGFVPRAITRQGERIHLWDGSGDRLVALDNSTYRPIAAWSAPEPILDAAFARTTGTGWAAIGSSGVAAVELKDDGSATAEIAIVDGSAEQVVADPGRGLAWALVQPGEVRATWPIPGTVLRLSEPSPTGDVAVYYTPIEGGDTAHLVLAPVEDVQTVEPLHIFLFTTIEEPSDANMGLPTRINDRYEGTGAVEWTLPSEIRALEPER
jgi:hypothetical protein